MVANSVVSVKRLYEPLKLGTFIAANIEVKYYQLSGHLANDNCDEQRQVFSHVSNALLSSPQGPS